MERIYKTVTKCNRRNEIFQTFVWWGHKFAPTIQTSLKLGNVANKSRSNLTFLYRGYSTAWPASMQIYGKKEILYVRVQLPQDLFGTPMSPFHCFETPIWPPKGGEAWGLSALPKGGEPWGLFERFFAFTFFLWLFVFCPSFVNNG